MKIIKLVIILSMFFGFLYAENIIEFELAFNIAKIDLNDELIGFQLFDSDNDGSDEIFAGFVINPSGSTTGCRIVQYNSEGDTLSSFSQVNLVNKQTIDFQLIHYENINLLIILYDAQDEWLMRIYNLETFELICDYSHDNPYHFREFYDFEIYEVNDQLQILLGLHTENDFNSDSYIERFIIDDYVIDHVETIWDSGYRIINQTENLLTIGSNCEIDIMPMDYEEYTREYLFSRLNINNTIPSELEIYYEMSGYHYFDQWTTIYDNDPADFSFLSNNDINFEEYGYLISETTRDDENGLQIKFICIDYLNNEIIWEQSIPCFEDITSHVTASTVLDFEDDCKFVIIFWRNYSSSGYLFIVLNRENGNIPFQGEVPYNGCWNYPIYMSFFIDRLNDEELLFFTGDENSLGYDVYAVSEFQVGANNFITPNSILSVTNFPNPFNPTTTIEFSIQNNSKVKLSIYNIKGQKIKTLIHNVYDKGSHSVVWNGDNESGQSISSGVYFYKLAVNGKTEAVKKCLLLK